MAWCRLALIRPPLVPPQTLVKSFEVCDLPVRTAKFVARKQWVITGADDMLIRVYNYNTMDKVKVFEAHTDYIRWGSACAPCTHAARVRAHASRVPAHHMALAAHGVGPAPRQLWPCSPAAPRPPAPPPRRCIAVHPTLPAFLTCSDDTLIKLWDWDKGFSCTQIFEGHSHFVMQVRVRACVSLALAHMAGH